MFRTDCQDASVKRNHYGVDLLRLSGEQLVSAGQPFELDGVVIGAWREHYNCVRPRSYLGYRPPAPVTLDEIHRHLSRSGVLASTNLALSPA